MTEEELKKKYHKMAIKYHPDKYHSIEATQRFQEISHSYLFLLNKIQQNNEDDENEEEYKNYKEKIYLIIEKLLNKEFLNEPLSQCIKHVISIIGDVCENKVQPIIENIKLKNAIRKQNKLIILKPNLKDLFENNLYKLNENGLVCIVPLWHNELIYENNNITVNVNCIPVLPNHINLDEENNIHITLKYKITDVFEKKIVINIDCNNECIKIYELELTNVKLLKKQIIVIKNEGISKININDIYDISKKSDLILHLTLEI
jgi:hypothetical protein